MSGNSLPNVPLLSPVELRNCDDAQRHTEVVHAVRKCGEAFLLGESIGDADYASGAAMVALTNLLGLFDSEDPGDHLLNTLIAVIVDIRNGTAVAPEGGEHPNILLRKVRPQIGLKKGHMHAEFQASVLTFLELGLKFSVFKTETEACKSAAEILNGLGFSLKLDDHSQPKSISKNTFRNWRKGEKDFPAAHKMANITIAKLSAQIIDGGVPDPEVLFGILKEKLTEVVMNNIKFRKRN